MLILQAVFKSKHTKLSHVQIVAKLKSKYYQYFREYSNCIEKRWLEIGYVKSGRMH